MVVRIRRNRIWFIAIGILFVVTAVISVHHLVSHKILSTDNPKNITTAVRTEKSSKQADIKNMRGVWIPYFSLETQEHTESAFKRNFDRLIATAKSHKMNTVIVHVRPFSDALYPSEYYPQSHILTGTQGETVSYDPLEYMITKTHESGMKFHAWINPYRISTESTPEEFSADNIVNTLSESSILHYNGGIYINPSSVEGRKLIIDGIKEVVEKYAVDGVQFDDYFYPDKDLSIDRKYYEDYVCECDSDGIVLSQTQWRKANVNMLISAVYDSIKQIKKEVIFGISPQGNISNCNDIGADVEEWCNTYGYADYICPQMYVNFDHAILPFDTMVEQWQELTKSQKIPLCIGLALYKANSSDYDDGTWQNSNDILRQEVEYCQQKGIDNFMLYDIDYFDKSYTQTEMQNLVNALDS